MPRPKYIPSDADLETAWKLRKSKKTATEIADILGVSIGQYRRARSVYNDYFNLKTRELRNKKIKLALPNGKALVKKKACKPKKDDYRRKTKLKESDICLETLELYLVCGFNNARIASLLGISEATFNNYKERFPAIGAIIEQAGAKTTVKLVKAIISQTQDRMVDDTAVASFQGNITTQKIKKHAPGNAALAKYYLANREKWATEPKPELTNNRGLILDMLDKIKGGDGHSND